MRSKIILFIPAIGWLICTTILLCLPGDDLPKNHLFDIPYFDKIVHFGMFFLLTSLFSWPFKFLDVSEEKRKLWLISIALYSLVYGIAMEFVQKYFIPNRAYDVIDILVDGLGCIAGYLFSHTFFKTRLRKVV